MPLWVEKLFCAATGRHSETNQDAPRHYFAVYHGCVPGDVTHPDSPPDDPLIAQNNFSFGLHIPNIG
ncbi:hypothetical protein M5K25_023819 [Dendrobium thyrsiflorum]|uniref:Uncharacterized protein n=1 Tax=Dendrobium thyrsiflorum TaxID=117978 RepID=A0ABD0U0H8_DENTH